MEVKLNILEESGVIDADTKMFILNVQEYLLSQKIVTKENSADMFLTHLAMADMRVKNEEKIVALPTNVVEEIFSNTCFPKAKILWKDILQFSKSEFDANEEAYIFMHIVNILGVHQDN